ncbi:hypothetical protein A2U01_0100699 [Trifolium medium]|uniref:Uncharacterized protein n=1 Tax=Trifolium medium TaxID=97028 RepID=A0A392UTS2_9FABA|nr:hypothetical protein [Trifolium medium]
MMFWINGCGILILSVDT